MTSWSSDVQISGDSAMFWFYVFWVACGILSYGICKGGFEIACRQNGYKWGFGDEVMCWLTSFLGLISLMVWIIVNGQYKTLKFTYRMPKDLIEKEV
jgi:hypothetical protein